MFSSFLYTAFQYEVVDIDTNQLLCIDTYFSITDSIQGVGIDVAIRS